MGAEMTITNWISTTVRAARSYLSTVLVVGLLVSNVLTVVSDSVHSAAFRAISSVGSIIGDVALERLLSNSPTKSTERKVVKETGRIRAVLADTEAKRQAAETNLKKLSGEHSALQKQTAKRSEAIKRFSANTLTRVAKNKTVELASLPERALPYAGVAVLVGVTAYELKSDCELLKDLNELSAAHEVANVDTSAVCGFQVPSAQAVWSKAISGASASAKDLYSQLSRHLPGITKAPEAPR